MSRWFAYAKTVGGALDELASKLEWTFSRNSHIEFDEYKDREQRRFLMEERKMLRYLKRQKLIEMHAISNKLVVRLTDKGWTKALRIRIKTHKVRCTKGACFLIFDIPEKERIARNMLRDFLKESGFIKLQHSVWMTKYDVIQPLQKLLQRQKLEKWIRIVRGEIVPSSLLDRFVIRRKYKN